MRNITCFLFLDHFLAKHNLIACIQYDGMSDFQIQHYQMLAVIGKEKLEKCFLPYQMAENPGNNELHLHFFHLTAEGLEISLKCYLPQDQEHSKFQH